MRTTLNINNVLLSKAQELTHITEKTKLIHIALEVLIEKMSQEKLRQLGGTEKKLKEPPRRRNK